MTDDYDPPEGESLPPLSDYQLGMEAGKREGWNEAVLSLENIISGPGPWFKPSAESVRVALLEVLKGMRHG